MDYSSFPCVQSGKGVYSTGQLGIFDRLSGFLQVIISQDEPG
jgi:hypothetical protein